MTNNAYVQLYTCTSGIVHLLLQLSFSFFLRLTHFTVWIPVYLFSCGVGKSAYFSGSEAGSFAA